MTNGLNEVIEKLEQQKEAIERALAALRDMGGSSAGAGAATTTAGRAVKAARKGGMTPEGRRRLSEALKKRWAAKRAGSSVRAKAVRKSGGMTAEGRKRLSDALKKRWAAKRASAKSAQTKRAAS